MNNTILRALSFFFVGALFLVSCSSEHRPEPIAPRQEKPQDQPIGTIALDLSADYVGQSTRSINLTDADKPKFVAEGSDWTTHAFLRNEEGTKQFYLSLSWSATGAVGENIQLAMAGSNVHDLYTGEAVPKQTFHSLERRGTLPLWQGG